MKFHTSKMALVAALVMLSACKTAEERAEERYQSGLALLAEGDQARAVLELRNVMELDVNHRGARTTLADIFIDQGKTQNAYSQLLFLAEQYPDDIEVRLRLAKMAFNSRNWDEFQRHGAVVVQNNSDDAEARTIDIGMRYQSAVADRDAPLRLSIAEEALSLIDAQPDSRILRSIVVDYYAVNSDIDKAVEQIDMLIALDPDRLDIYEQKLALIAQKEDEELIENQLIEMIDAFPEDEDIKSRLLRLYSATGQIDKAEDFLRKISSPSDEDPANFLTLIRFLAEVRSDEEAMAEIERGIVESPKKMPFEALRASMLFSQGDTDTAIAEMEEIIAKNEPSDERRGLQVGLAQMLVAVGNEVGARRLVEEVLAEDAMQVEALKMQGRWSLAADDPDAAVLALRTAIDADPENTEAIEILAQAYVRSGKLELSREYLALAVETSGNAPEQSIAYANVLIDREQYLPAESVLIPALRLSPGNPDLLAAMGRLYIGMGDQARTTQVIDTLRRIDSDRTKQIANTLRAEQLQAESGVEEAVAFLEALASSEDAGLDAQILLLRGHLAAGNNEAASTLIAQLQEEYPGNSSLAYASAAIKGASGDLVSAEADYRALLEENPDNPRVWLELSRILERAGKREEAEEVIAEGLSISNDDPNLLWARASILETEYRIEEAIAIYEQLYERASDSVIVANNLASLLSSYRDDEESLQRAFNIARRFREAKVPALQDTYGWILHRIGESEDALPYLEEAAAGLADDALTQYHLAVIYLELEMTEKAKQQLQRTLDVAGPSDTRPQIEKARDQLAAMRSLSVEQ